MILKEFQREPLRGKLLHADFYEVALDKRLEVKVHIELEGTPVGVKLQGGIVDFVTRELEVECLPADIPEKIVVDISHLELGKHLRVSDLKVSDKVKVLMEPELVVVHVVLPRAEVVAEPAAVEGAVAEAGAAEPEVIKKGKTDKAEGEAAEAKPRSREAGEGREAGEEVTRASWWVSATPGPATSAPATTPASWPIDELAARIAGGGPSACGRLGGRGDARRASRRCSSSRRAS